MTDKPSDQSRPYATIGLISEVPKLPRIAEVRQPDPMTPEERAAMSEEARGLCLDVQRGTAGGVICELPLHHTGPHEWERPSEATKLDAETDALWKALNAGQLHHLLDEARKEARAEAIEECAQELIDSVGNMANGAAQPRDVVAFVCGLADDLRALKDRPTSAKETP